MVKIAVCFPMYFYSSNTERPGAGQFLTTGPSVEKLGKGPLGNAAYRISST